MVASVVGLWQRFLLVALTLLIGLFATPAMAQQATGAGRDASMEDGPIHPRYFPEAERLTMIPVTSLSVEPASGAVIANVPLPVPPLPPSFGIDELLSIQWVNGLQNGPLGPGWRFDVGSIAPSQVLALTDNPSQTWRAWFPGGGG